MENTGLSFEGSVKSSRARGTVRSAMRSKNWPFTLREPGSGDGVMIGRRFAAAKWSQVTRPSTDTSAQVSHRGIQEGKSGPLGGRGPVC